MKSNRLGRISRMVRRPLVAALAAAGLMGISGTASAISVGFDITGDGTFDSSLSMLAGTSATVGVYVSQSGSEVTTYGGLVSAQVAIGASNGSLFSSTSATLNSAVWGGPTSPSNDDDLTDGSGKILQAVVDPIAVQVTANYVKLFDLVLNAGASAGTSLLSLGHTADPTSDFVAYLSGTTHSYLVSNGDLSFSGLTVNITPVPIPGAVWLFGSGLLGLAGFRFRAGRSQDAG